MDKRNEKTAPFWGFYALFSFPAKAFGLSRAPWETRFAKRERRESISFFAHIFSTNIFLDRNERFVHLASISSTRDVNDEWTTHSIWPPNLTPFRLNKQKNKKRKKINTFRAKGNERNIPWYCVISPEFRRNSRPARFWETWMRRTFFIRVSRVLVFYRISMDTTPQRERGVKKVGQRKLKISFLSFFVFLFFLPFFV